ncbi:MAG: hypothetical protein ACN2B6_01820 [Rickettsiales bacterium]
MVSQSNPIKRLLCRNADITSSEWKTLDSILRNAQSAAFRDEYLSYRNHTPDSLPDGWQGTLLPEEVESRLRRKPIIMAKLLTAGHVIEHDKSRPVIELRIVAHHVQQAEQAPSRL